MRIAVAGGGLAGLAAAKRLVDAGHEVTVLEGNRFLGGRASTYEDADGDWIEQGLHLFLGVYSELKRLLREVATPPERILRFSSEIRLADPQGVASVLAINPLRAPLRTALSAFLKNDYLGLRAKLETALLATPSLVPFELLRRFDDRTLADWWGQVSGNEKVLERFLRPFCRGIQFTDVEDFSRFPFFGLVHHVLRDPAHALLGAYLGPRDQTMFRPLASWLLEHGATVRTEAKLKSIGFAHGQVRGFVLEGGSRVEADAYVAAIPLWELVDLMPDALRRMRFFGDLEKLPIAPAISVQLFFDREVIDDDRFTLVARSRACVYQDLSRTHFPDARGSRISVIVSPADDLLQRPDGEITEMVLADLGKADPRIRAGSVRKAVVLKHRRHLLRPLPGVLTRRPSQATPIPNFFLAGDWTDQPFFGSQEGAVRGGNACARKLLESARTGALREPRPRKAPRARLVVVEADGLGADGDAARPTGVPDPRE